MPSRLVIVLAAVAAALAVALSAAASTPPPVDARAVIVLDGRSGDVLYEENGDRRMAMASITKLMTAIVTLEHARPKEMVTVSPRAIGQGGSSIFLTAGEQLT
ncbi:MAG TPA: D-alanyl-D-alanine carboxypeptidase, partial [Myxococcota bacterium]|nr:D-alanyl-D-alanine carboxypeptidase [Myxococcota bacterium]